VRLQLPRRVGVHHRLGRRESGQKLGKYELLDSVGQGAFGTVYKARDAELDRVVAIKVPRAGNLAGPQELDRFLREARSVAQLRHPSIVPVHDVGQMDGVPYLVSDFVEGVTLSDLLSARTACRRTLTGRRGTNWTCRAADWFRAWRLDAGHDAVEPYPPLKVPEVAQRFAVVTWGRVPIPPHGLTPLHSCGKW
jgi:hypothetical protein